MHRYNASIFFLLFPLLYRLSLYVLGSTIISACLTEAICEGFLRKYEKKREGPCSTMIQVGFLSLWFRQTNFIWVCVFAAIAVLQAVQTHREADRLELALCETSFSDLLREISDLLPRLLNQWPMVLRIVAIFIPSIILATGFLLWNGSIVLGLCSWQVDVLKY